ncbi:MAG TPA: hypothetical protein VFX16_05410 [Pseudonocardiaceae bacterium]|nr:hypothetical protein [Pseudonocardiaceae bacterium]
MNRASVRDGGPERLPRPTTPPKVRRLLALLPLLVLACASCADPLGGQAAARPVPVLSASQTVVQSIGDLAEAGVLHYRGALTNPNGKQIALDVSVTATGEAGGTLTVGGQQGSMVVVDGVLYVDAPAQFWSLLSGDPGSEADAVGSRWVKVPSVTVGIDIGVSLRPNAFAEFLSEQVDGTIDDPLTDQPTTAVHGVKALHIDVGNSTIDIATTGTHGVLHVAVPAGLGRAQQVSLDVADVSGSEAGIYQDLNQQAKQLGTAVDTSVDIEQGGQSWGNCTAAACSVVVTFTNASLVATKVVVSGKWTGDGQPTGTCRAVVGPVAAGKPATAACTNSSPQWTSFFDRAHATPGQHPYEVDWTAEALAAPLNLARLAGEAAAAAKPATADPARTTGHAYVYVINYQDSTGHARVWKYGVNNTTAWRSTADSQLTACRSVSRTSCTAALVTAAPDRPSADALVTALVTRSKTCPPGQWVDCAPSATG